MGWFYVVWAYLCGSLGSFIVLKGILGTKLYFSWARFKFMFNTSALFSCWAGGAIAPPGPNIALSLSQSINQSSKFKFLKIWWLSLNSCFMYTTSLLERIFTWALQVMSRCSHPTKSTYRKVSGFKTALGTWGSKLEYGGSICKVYFNIVNLFSLGLVVKLSQWFLFWNSFLLFFLSHHIICTLFSAVIFLCNIVFGCVNHSHIDNWTK